jgi:hypothetical protein
VLSRLWPACRRAVADTRVCSAWSDLHAATAEMPTAACDEQGGGRGEDVEDDGLGIVELRRGQESGRPWYAAYGPGY